MSKVINITGRNYSSKYSLQGKDLFESRLQMNSTKRKVHLPINSKMNNDSNQLGSSSYINTDNMSNFRNILIIPEMVSSASISLNPFIFIFFSIVIKKDTIS